MRVRSLFWCAVFVFAAAMVAAAPPIAFCDDVTAIDTGKSPIGNVDGLNQGLAASRDYFWNESGFTLDLVLYYTNTLDNKLAAGLVYKGNYQDLGMETSSGSISCPNPKQVAAGWGRTSQKNEGQRMAVFGQVCDGSAEIAMANLNMEQGGGNGLNVSTEWSKPDLKFDSTSQPDSISVAAFNGMDFMEEISVCTGGLSVQCSKNSGPVMNVVTKFGGSQYTSKFHHTYDNQGNILSVGTDSQGTLGYAKYPRGSTQADAGSVKNLGQASKNQSWAWPRIGAAPNGTQYVAAFNALEGNLYVYYKAADSPDHWYFFVLSSSGGPLGKFLSMAVDNQTNNAMLTFADSEGHFRVMIVTPDGRRQITTFDSKYGQPHSTATTGGDGLGNSLLLTTTFLDSIAARIGVKLEF